MEPVTPLGPLLGRCAHLARERMDARLADCDVTPAQTHVLMYLMRSGGQATQCALTDFLKVRPSTTNGIVDRLVERGLVERTVSGTDARRRLVTLSEKGREQQSLFRKRFLETEELMLRGITPQEEQTLRGILGRIIQNLEEDRAQC